MATTIQLYNHTLKLLGNQEVDLTNLKLMNLDSSASFDASHTDIASISGDEVSGNGWDAGGEPLTGVAVTTVTTNDAKLDANDLAIAASGGSIGPVYAQVLYDATNDFPLAYVTPDPSPQTATVGNNFNTTWDAGGIITFQYT